MQIRAEGIGIRQKTVYGGYNPMKTFMDLYGAGYGSKCLYTGFQAGFAARMSAVTVRNGVYKFLYDRVKPRKPTNDLTYKEKICISGFAGGIGAIVANPFEIIAVRSISDIGRSAEFRRDYKSLVDGYNIVSKEAPHGAWRGLTATLAKAVVLNTIMIWPYDQMNEHCWNTFGESTLNKPIAVLWASLFGYLTLPLDNIKTRMQNQFTDVKLNRMNYTGFVDAMKQAWYTESKHFFFVASWTYYAKTVAYAFCTIYTMDVFLEGWKRGANLPEEYM